MITVVEEKDKIDERDVATQGKIYKLDLYRTILDDSLETRKSGGGTFTM
jgi:hypothetical protein